MDNPLKKLIHKYQKGQRSAFQAMPYLSIDRLAEAGVKFNHVLKDSSAMTEAALWNLDFGFESTILPYDLNVEAEILGAKVTYFDEVEGIPVYPTIAMKPVATAEDFIIPDDIAKMGRMPLILKSIAQVKQKASDRGAVGVFMPGPFMLAQQAVDMDELFLMVIERPDELSAILSRVTVFINKLKEIYIDAGAEFVVFEEGGATTISPKVFEDLLLPHLKDVFAVKKVPHIFSMTGSSDNYIEFMVQCNPDGIGVDQQCDIEKARGIIPPSILLFAICGSLDLLASATRDEITETVVSTLDKGASYVGPPADIYPPAKIENIKFFVEVIKGYKGSGG